MLKQKFILTFWKGKAVLVSPGCCAGYVPIHLATRIMHFAAERRLVSGHF